MSWYYSWQEDISNEEEYWWAVMLIIMMKRKNYNKVSNERSEQDND